MDDTGGESFERFSSVNDDASGIVFNVFPLLTLDNLETLDRLGIYTRSEQASG